MKLTKHDMHVHTNLSLCASATADPFEYIKTAATEGLETIGFSNHYWDEDVPGASGWYAQQNTEHVMQRVALPAEGAFRLRDGIRRRQARDNRKKGGAVRLRARASFAHSYERIRAAGRLRSAG